MTRRTTLWLPMRTVVGPRRQRRTTQPPGCRRQPQPRRPNPRCCCCCCLRPLPRHVRAASHVLASLGAALPAGPRQRRGRAQSSSCCCLRGQRRFGLRRQSRRRWVSPCRWHRRCRLRHPRKQRHCCLRGLRRHQGRRPPPRLRHHPPSPPPPPPTLQPSRRRGQPLHHVQRRPCPHGRRRLLPPHRGQVQRLRRRKLHSERMSCKRFAGDADGKL